MVKVVFNIPSLEELKPYLQKIDIFHVVLISAILRFFVMSFPSDGGMIFDEAHYVPAANAILQGIPANAEHPPLTKLIVATFIKVFGNFWFSWRFPIVITALISTYLVYCIAKNFMSKMLAVISALIISFDIIFFIHGNIYMLEMPSIMFGLAFILLLMNKHYIWSGIAWGLSFLCNEKALFLLLAMIIYQVFMYSRKKHIHVTTFFKQILTFGFVGIILVAFGGLWINDSIWKPASATIENIGVQATVYQNATGFPITTSLATITSTMYKYIANPIQHLIFMLNYFTGINANLATPIQDYRPPISWITPFGADPFNSAQYLKTVVTFGSKTEVVIDYAAQVPIFIWYMTLPILAVAIWLFRKDDFAKFYIAMFAGTYLPRLIVDIPYHNMTFIHYFLYTIPAVCIGIPWFWNKVGGKYKYYFLAANIIAIVIFFFCFFPIGLVRNI